MKNTILFIIVFFIFSEILSRSTFLFSGIEVRQKYLLEEQSFGLDKVNGRGAVGSEDLGQKLKIAIIGSSPSEMPHTSFSEKWSQKLQKIIGSDKVHIDNYSIGYANLVSAEALVDSLVSRSMHYDIVLVGFTFKLEESLYNQSTFHYSFRWQPDPKSYSAFLSLLQKFYERVRTREPWLDRINLDIISRAFAIRDYDQIDPRLTTGNFFYDSDLRKREDLQHLFVQENSLDFKSSDIQPVRRRLNRFIDKLEILSENIYWSPVRIGYHPEMTKNYHQNLHFFKPVKEFRPEQPQFYNLQSLYRDMEAQSDLMLNLVRAREIKVIDWPAYINSKTTTLPGLYRDEYHLSPKGAQLAAQFIYEKIREHIRN